jgi:hypothetical protein
MKRWKIAITTIAATLFAVTAVQAQNVIFSDDFEDTTLDAYNLNIGGSDAQNIDESGNRIAELAHVNGVRTGLGNNVLAGFNMARFDFGFKVKVLSNPAPDDASIELSRDHYGSGLERIFQMNLDDNVSAQDVWDTFRIILNNTASPLTYDQGGGIAGTVAAGEASVWRNGTLYSNSWALAIGDGTSTVTQGEGAKSFGFLCNLAEANTTIRVDDIVLQDLPQTEVVFDTSPAATLSLPFAFPYTQASEAVTAWYHEGPSAASVQITALNIGSQSHAGSFSTSATTPLTLNNPSPSNEVIGIDFDNGVAGLTHNQTATATLDLVWTEVGSGVSNTNEITLSSTYSDPDVALVLSPSDELELSFKSPETTATGPVSATYIQGQALTNVQITAISVVNESHSGAFTNITSLPIVIPDPSSNETFEIAFDNSVAGLAEAATATGQVVVTWNELGSTNRTEVLSVSATRDTAAVMEMNFASAPTMGGIGYGTYPLNNFATYGNRWNFAGGLTHSAADGGYLKNDSGANSRAAFNLIKFGTAGMDDIGAVDTVPLAEGLYRFDFTYSVPVAAGRWGIGAYALEAQDISPAVANVVNYDVGQSSATSYTPPLGAGAAEAVLYSGGLLSGTETVAQTTGSVTVNVASGAAVLFTMWGHNDADIQLYDIKLVRIGDYEDASPANAVLDARFGADITAELVSDFDYDTNDDPSGSWTHAASGSWEGKALKKTSNTANRRSMAIVTRAGTAGYDDFGADDTIALTSGVYTVSLDVIYKATTAGGVGNVSVWSFGQDATGNVNDVRLDMGEATPDTVNMLPIIRGTATTNLLASKDYTIANVFERVAFTNLTVNEGEDLAIVLNGYADGDWNRIDNVQVLRTADLPPVYTPYETWAIGYGLTGDDALPETDVEPDGMDNLLEYALGGNPNVDDASIKLPSHGTDASGSPTWLDYTYNRRTNYVALGLDYIVETDADLVNAPGWTNENFTVSVGPVSGDFESVTNRIDTGAAAKYFIRLRVQQN